MMANSHNATKQTYFFVVKLRRPFNRSIMEPQDCDIRLNNEDNHWRNNQITSRSPCWGARTVISTACETKDEKLNHRNGDWETVIRAPFWTPFTTDMSSNHVMTVFGDRDNDAFCSEVIIQNVTCVHSRIFSRVTRFSGTRLNICGVHCVATL